MVTLFVLRDILYRAAVMTAIQGAVQDALRAPSLSLSFQGPAGNGSYWYNTGLRHYLPSPPSLHLVSLSTGWLRPGGRFIDCAVLSQVGYAGYVSNFTGTLVTPPAPFIAPVTPTLPAFTCPPTSTPPPPSPVKSAPAHLYKALLEFRRPPAFIHHQVSNPLNPDDIFEFKILETVIDRYFIDLAWKPTVADSEVSIGRAWAAVWVHMACVLVFWILSGTKRVRLALTDLLPGFILPFFIELVSIRREAFENEMASVVQDFVLELGLMDLFSSMCKDMPVDTMATEEILPTEQLWSTEDSDEDDMAAVEDLIQIAPMELSEAPVDISVPESGPVISTEELESDEEDMAAVEGLVQLMLDEPESAEESTSSEESDSDDEMAAVEDMVQVELEEESLLAEETDAVVVEQVATVEELEEPPVKETALARPSLNKDAPAFVPRFVHPTAPERPTVDKVNETLDALISRLETGVGANFGGPRNTPAPALVRPDAAPITTPVPPPPPAPSAASEPKKIRTYYAERLPRPPRRK